MPSFKKITLPLMDSSDKNTDIAVIDRPEGRWLVRRLGTRGEARPAGWSLHRTGMRLDMRVGLLVFSYTEELTRGT